MLSNWSTNSAGFFSLLPHLPIPCILYGSTVPHKIAIVSIIHSIHSFVHRWIEPNRPKTSLFFHFLQMSNKESELMIELAFSVALPFPSCYWGIEYALNEGNQIKTILIYLTQVIELIPLLNTTSCGWSNEYESDCHSIFNIWFNGCKLIVLASRRFWSN